MGALAGLRPRNQTRPWASTALSQAIYTVAKTVGTVGAIVIGAITMVRGITMVLMPMHVVVRQRVETRQFISKYAVQSGMSALGQKQTCAVQNVMSAITPIATAKAKFRKKAMSALPPKADMCSAVGHVCFGPIADINDHRRVHADGRQSEALQVQ